MNLIQFKYRETLIKYNHREDFGHDWYVQILNTGKHFPKPIRNKSVFQISVSWNDYPSWPYIQIQSGGGTVLSILFWGYKFGIDIDVLSHTWNWDYMREEDGKETELV